MDAYQLRYHKFLMNIRESSKVSLQFYLALQDFLQVIKTNINPRLAWLFAYRAVSCCQVRNLITFYTCFKTFYKMSCYKLKPDLYTNTGQVRVLFLLDLSGGYLSAKYCVMFYLILKATPAVPSTKHLCQETNFTLSNICFNDDIT